jgi:hypothetical protein
MYNLRPISLFSFPSCRNCKSSCPRTGVLLSANSAIGIPIRITQGVRPLKRQGWPNLMPFQNGPSFLKYHKHTSNIEWQSSHQLIRRWAIGRFDLLGLVGMLRFLRGRIHKLHSWRLWKELLYHDLLRNDLFENLYTPPNHRMFSRYLYRTWWDRVGRIGSVSPIFLTGVQQIITERKQERE